MEPYIPEFGLDSFCKKEYYENQMEREAFGMPSISYDEYLAQNEEYLLDKYEHFLSIG